MEEKGVERDGEGEGEGGDMIGGNDDGNGGDGDGDGGGGGGGEGGKAAMGGSLEESLGEPLEGERLNWTEEELTILIRVLNHTTDIRTLEYIVLVCWCSARNPLDRAEATRYEIGYNLCLCVRCRLRFCVVILRRVSVYNSLYKPVFFAVCLIRVQL